MHGAPLDSYPGRTTPVLRLSGNVPSGTTFSFLGLPASRVTSVGGWRADFASEPLASLARAITPKHSVALRSTILPRGRQFSLRVTAKGDDIGVRALFRSRLGDYEAVALGHTNGARPTILHGRIPFIGATLAQLRLDILNQGRLSANGGLGLQPSAKGEVTFGAARVNGKRVASPFANWVGTGGVSGGALRLGYVLTSDQNGVFRPRQPTDGVPLPVLATPRVIAEAGPHGIIPVQIEGEQIAARIVGTIRRFPSVDGDVVVADLTNAATILDTRSPGLGTTDELWVNVPPAGEASAAATLSHAPFTQLSLQSRAATLAELRADPLARGSLLTLAGTAGVALLLALVGLLLSVVGDVRDDRGELFDLEAQGASPATIRAHLRLRALLVAAFGVVGGLALGAVLTSLVIALVSVTAAATRPEPPLRLVLDVPLLVVAAALYVLVAALLVGAATTLRGRSPQRAAEALT